MNRRLNVMHAAMATAAFVFCFETALAQTPPAAEPPADSAQSSNSMEQPMVGDHWTYEVRDEIAGVIKFTTSYTITDITPTDFAVRQEWPGKPSDYTVYDRSWNLKDNGVWKFSPNDGTGVKLPLKVGNSWSFRGDALDSSHGVSVLRSGSSKVAAMENLTTSAGTFETFRIETSIVTRIATDPTRKYEATVIVWYAPSIDHWVKHTEKITFRGRTTENLSSVLIDYGRR